MKGLILKDLYQAGEASLFFIALTVVLILMFGGENIVYYFVPLYICSSGIYFAWEREKCDIFDNTLPFSRAELVSVKYISALCMNLFVVLCCAFFGALMLLNGKLTVGTYLSMLLNSALIGLPGAVAPVFMFKRGGKEGFLSFGGTIPACIISGFVISTFLAVEKHFFGGEVNALGFFCGLAAVAAIYALSWRLSIAAYNKRDLS